MNELLNGLVPNFQTENRYIHKSGDAVSVLWGVSRAQVEGSDSVHLIFQIQNINGRKQAEKRLLHDAFHDGLTRAISLARQLLGSADRAFVFHRYLETVLPEDNARTRLLSHNSNQTSPEESLVTLRHGLTAGAEVIEGLLRSQRVPFRLFHAALSGVYREIDRSAFFNPLNALEFRPGFDRIKSAQVLELIRSVPGPEAHRLVALTFLSLFRMLRYLTLVTRILADPGKRREQVGNVVAAPPAVVGGDTLPPLGHLGMGCVSRGVPRRPLGWPLCDEYRHCEEAGSTIKYSPVA